MKREALTLKAFAGFGTINVLLENDGVLLLECAVSGVSLKSYFPEKDNEAIQIIGECSKKLHQAPIPSDYDLPHIKDWLMVLDNDLDISTDTLHKATRLRDELIASSAKPVLLHGDLHHDNILHNGNTWAVITVSLLKTQLVVSHGDLDQKNVLGDNSNNPILIDWECARKLNPTQEIVNACLDWSGITTEFNKDIFLKMMQTYLAAGGNLDNNIIPAAFHAILGNWINWMAYNIERACMNEPEQKILGIDQVTQVLGTIIQLKNITPNLMVNILENKPKYWTIQFAHF